MQENLKYTAMHRFHVGAIIIHNASGLVFDWDMLHLRGGGGGQHCLSEFRTVHCSDTQQPGRSAAGPCLHSLMMGRLMKHSA